MIGTIADRLVATIATITDRLVSLVAAIATIAEESFPYDHYNRRLNVFSAIATI